MAKILSVVTRPTEVETTTKDELGVEHTTSSVEQLVHSVTFENYQGTPQTLTFHPKGTHVEGAVEEQPRVVGEDSPYYEYTDPQQAVQDYLDGKVI